MKGLRLRDNMAEASTRGGALRFATGDQLELRRNIQALLTADSLGHTMDA